MVMTIPLYLNTRKTIETNDIIDFICNFKNIKNKYIIIKHNNIKIMCLDDDHLQKILELNNHIQKLFI